MAARNRVKAPVTILREQGSLLGKKTKNLVQGEVLEATGSEDLFVYLFFIIAPALSHYRYKLLTLRHDISLYPVIVDVEERIIQAVDSKFHLQQLDPDGNLAWIYHEANSEEDFLELLKQIFRSEKAMQVVTGLLSQADPNWQSPNRESSIAST